ncbi:tyrosine-protein phosphatase [Effusibacillus consociatus]|uniref:Tyrosine-protein phosphatase n=1 Tax=Effusibacillus consociatus TaxID=1117041 RepID=A0ABV9QA06_9BACL
MIDIHSHILPGVDDGAKNLDEAVNMALMAYRDGIHTVVATPHHKNGVYHTSAELIVELVGELNSILLNRGIPVTVLPGMEPHVYSDFCNDLLDGTILTLNRNKKYVFLELPYDQVPRYLNQIIFQIVLAGFIPIIPHPERNYSIRKQPDILYEAIKRGALSQLTAGSLLGAYGKPIQDLSEKLIEHNMVHIIASDAHNTGKRRPALAEAYSLIEQKWGKEIFIEFMDNAKAIIDGKDIYTLHPEKFVKKKLFGIF